MVQLHHLHVTKMGFAAGHFAVVIKQIPLAFEFYDGMVIGPAKHRLKNNSLISEWTIRVITNAISDIVRVTGRPGEVIFAVIFVHPGGFKKTSFIVTG